MKKIISIILVLVLVLSMTACGNSAKGAFTGAMNAFKKGDIEGFSKYVGSDFGVDAEMSKEYKDIYKLMTENFEYKVIKVEEDGDKAVVEAEIENINMAKVMASAAGDMLGLVFKGLDDDELVDEMTKILKESIKDNKDETITMPVKVSMTKGKDGWIMDLNDSFFDAMFGGLNDLGSLLG